MRIQIRASERQAVVAALEAEYKSDKDAADTIIKLVTGLLAERQTFGVKVPVGPTMSIAIGPMWHSQAAKAMSVSLPGSSVHTLASPVRVLELMDPATHIEEKVCDSCSHPTFAHGFSSRPCVVPKCRCRKRFP